MDLKKLKAINISLAVLFIFGLIVGFSFKKALKPKLTSSPDDREVSAVKQNYDFKGAQEKIEREIQEMQEQQAAPTDIEPEQE